MAPTALRSVIRATRNFGPVWRYGFNLRPTLAYRLNHSRRPSGEALRVLSELNRNGVALTSAEKLLGSASCYAELCAAIERAEERAAAQIQKARETANDSAAVGRKTFLVELLGPEPVLDHESAYARFALQEQFLQIANAYYGMYTRLRYYNVWHNVPTAVEARESQLWHYDREDFLILKVFLHYSEVGAESGPFTYAPRTHRKAPRRREPRYFIEGGVRRTTDEQMAAVVPREQWVQAVGPKGTIVFADTRGYHKGGLVRDRDRIMYVSMFTSQASQSRELLQRPGKPPALDNRERFFALS